MSGDLAEPGPVILLAWAAGIESRNDTYEVVARMYFPGSKHIGIPNNIKVVAEVDVAATPGDIRIYDLTNSQIIAELTGIDDLVPTILDMGVLSKIPNEEAIWEIQLRVTSLLPNDIILYSLSMLL